MSQNRHIDTEAVKGWFCTWPQCPISKELALKILDEKLDIQEYVICEEQHKDGSPHLHAFIKLCRKKRFRPDLFDLKDLEKNYHGEYQKAKSFRAVCKYVMKDKNYISNFDVDKYLNKKGKLTKEDLLREVDDVLDDRKITPLQVTNWYRNSCTYKMLQKKRLPDELPEKKRHLWIYGPSNTGKTTLLRQQMREKGEENFFEIPTNNDWVGYSDQYYLWMDEYKGQLTIQQLNRICDGGAKMNVKGATVQLRWDCQVIILSNYSIADCYSKCDAVVLDSLYNRFIEERSDKRSDEVELNN